MSQFNKVIYIVKSQLSYYPPCMSQIQMLQDLGVDIEVWYGSSAETALDILDRRGIPRKQLVDPRGRFKGKLDIVNNWIEFRRVLERELKRSYRPEWLLWFGTAESSMPMIGHLGKYAFVTNALELYDEHPLEAKMLGVVSRDASAMVACERTRAYIMRYWWSLDRLPYVMPNKPYGLGNSCELPVTTDATRAIVDELAGKPFVIYQGIFQNVRYLEELAGALEELGSDLYLVLLGVDNLNIAPRIAEIYPRTRYFSSVPAPTHLEVTSRARIGVVYYDDLILNEAFCAPNKIYEYSAFGMPMLANKIPGLEGTVGAAGAAICSDFTKDDLKRAISEIEGDYERFSTASTRFFEATDNMKTMRRIVSDLGVRRE